MTTTEMLKYWHKKVKKLNRAYQRSTQEWDRQAIAREIAENWALIEMLETRLKKEATQ